MNSNYAVQVTAITSPNSAWAWGQLNWGTNLQLVSRGSAGSQNVTCQMGGDPSQSVQIQIYDLTSLTPSAGTVQQDGRVKLYETTNSEVVLAAITSPNAPVVWSLIQWLSSLISGPGPDGMSGGDAANQVKVALSPARDVQVTATLGCDPAWGQKSVQTTLHICKWPNLEVQQVEFDSKPVLNDGVQEIGKAFDKKWIKGRPDPATNCVTASTPQLEPAMQLDSSGGWDARWVQGGFATVYTQPGSAVSWVMSRNSGAPGGIRVNPETFAVYLQPRFAKGPVAGMPISAIQEKDGVAQVLFSRDSETRVASTRKIGKSMTSIESAQLLRDSTGYWLFTLAHLDGATEPEPGNAPRLFAERLDGELHSKGGPIRVLGGNPVNEFDVDPTSNNEIAVFATTPQGAIYAMGALKDGPLPKNTWREMPSKLPLSSPSLLVQNGAAYLAVIERRGEKDSRVLRGQVD